MLVQPCCWCIGAAVVVVILLLAVKFDRSRKAGDVKLQSSTPSSSIPMGSNPKVSKVKATKILPKKMELVDATRSDRSAFPPGVDKHHTRVAPFAKLIHPTTSTPIGLSYQVVYRYGVLNIMVLFLLFCAVF